MREPRAIQWAPSGDPFSGVPGQIVRLLATEDGRTFGYGHGAGWSTVFGTEHGDITVLPGQFVVRHADGSVTVEDSDPLVVRAHNHPPYRPACSERRTADGVLRGACLNDDGADRDETPTAAPGSLTAEEAEIARRFFAGEATDEEMRPVIEAHLQRLLDSGQMRAVLEGNVQRLLVAADRKDADHG